MSVPEFILEITEPAEADFRDLLSFTLQTWGQEQFAAYNIKINSALKAITGNPQIGTKKHGLMVYHTGRHKIFYCMDAVRHLPESE